MSEARQAVLFEDLDEQKERARVRLAHLLEAETGHRSGSVFGRSPASRVRSSHLSTPR